MVKPTCLFQGVVSLDLEIIVVHVFLKEIKLREIFDYGNFFQRDSNLQIFLHLNHTCCSGTNNIVRDFVKRSLITYAIRNFLSYL